MGFTECFLLLPPISDPGRRSLLFSQQKVAMNSWNTFEYPSGKLLGRMGWLYLFEALNCLSYSINLFFFFFFNIIIFIFILFHLLVELSMFVSVEKPR
jgi:hypothetical protein